MIERQLVFKVIRNKAANPLAVFEQYLDTAESMHPWGKDVYWHPDKTKFIINVLDFHDARRIQNNSWLDFPIGINPFIQLKNWKQRGIVPNVFPFEER